jgi:hypothetical protein
MNVQKQAATCANGVMTYYTGVLCSACEEESTANDGVMDIHEDTCDAVADACVPFLQAIDSVGADVQSMVKAAVSQYNLPPPATPPLPSICGSAGCKSAVCDKMLGGFHVPMDDDEDEEGDDRRRLQQQPMPMDPQGMAVWFSDTARRAAFGSSANSGSNSYSPSGFQAYMVGARDAAAVSASAQSSRTASARTDGSSVLGYLAVAAVAAAVVAVVVRSRRRQYSEIPDSAEVDEEDDASFGTSYGASDAAQHQASL